MKLEECREPLAYEIAFWMQGLLSPIYPLAELGKLSLEISDKLRALAIINLVSQGNSDFFYHNLIRSGIARETYLSRVKTMLQPDDHHFCSGRYQPLMDVIAAAEF